MQLFWCFLGGLFNISLQGGPFPDDGEEGEVRSLYKSSVFQDLIQCCDTGNGSKCLKAYKRRFMNELRPTISATNRMALESCLDASAFLDNDIELLLNIQHCFSQVDLMNQIEQLKLESHESSSQLPMVVVGYGVLFGLIIYSQVITSNQVDAIKKEQLEMITRLNRSYEKYQITIESNHERITNLVEFVNKLNQTIKSELRVMKIKFSREDDLCSDVNMLAGLYQELKNDFNYLSQANYFNPATSANVLKVPQNSPEDSLYNTLKFTYDNNNKKEMGRDKDKDKNKIRSKRAIQQEEAKVNSDVNLSSNSNSNSNLTATASATASATTTATANTIATSIPTSQAPPLNETYASDKNYEENNVEHVSLLRMHNNNSRQSEEVEATYKAMNSNVHAAKTGNGKSFDTMIPYTQIGKIRELPSKTDNHHNKANFDIATPEGRDKLKNFLTINVPNINNNDNTASNTNGNCVLPSRPITSIIQRNAHHTNNATVASPSNIGLRYNELPRYDHNMKKLKRIFIPGRGWVSRNQVEAEETKYGTASFVQIPRLS